MGLVTNRPPEQLISELLETAPTRYFVELGSFKGSTALWASKKFEFVYTVEGSEKLYHIARERLSSAGNAEIIHSDSRHALPRICEKLDSAAIFWMDSHWAGEDTYGADDQCPLLEELEIVLAGDQDHVLLIDDARFFLSAPYLPFKPEQWPSVSDILDCVREFRTDYRIHIIDDVIILAPSSLDEPIQSYCQMRNTVMEWRMGTYYRFLNRPGPMNFVRLLRVLAGVVLKKAGLAPEISGRTLRKVPQRVGVLDD